MSSFDRDHLFPQKCCYKIYPMLVICLKGVLHHNHYNINNTLLKYQRRCIPTKTFALVVLSRFLWCVTGAGLSGRQTHRTQGVFNHTEDYVLLPDERTVSLCCWDSRTAERKNLLSLGHNNIVRCIVHSPTNPGFMTCSDDFRARFWYRRTTTD